MVLAPWSESPFARALIAGAVAGTSADLSLYPIDTLKTRLQSSQGFNASGGFRGVYAGVGSALIGSAPGAALFFVTYEFLKSSFHTYHKAHGRKSSGRTHWSDALGHMIAASVGEVAACAVRVPTEVVKQRAQALQYSSSFAAVTAILHQRHHIGAAGVWREMYRGWNVTIMREVPFTIIQFPLWEAMKEWRRQTKGRNIISPVESAIFGSVAGAIAAGMTTPLDVLKTRLMLSKERQKTMKLLIQIVEESGPRAFFAGIGPRMIWISAGGAIFLGSYEWAYNSMGPRRGQRDDH